MHYYLRYGIHIDTSDAKKLEPPYVYLVELRSIVMHYFMSDSLTDGQIGSLYPCKSPSIRTGKVFHWDSCS